jgi:nucleoside-diphosphate-sugar epimerase
MRLTILRFTQLYGPGEPHGVFLQRVFLEKAREGKPIPLVRGGRDERDFLWVEDAASAVQSAVEKQAEGIFNIASGIGTSIKTIAELLCQETGSASELVINDDGEPALSQVYSIDLARKELGFNPVVSMGDGIARLCR